MPSRFSPKVPRLHPIYEPPPSTPQTAMNLSARKFKRGEAVEPAGALAHSSPRKVQDRPMPVFVSPPRKTYADDASGDSLACAAPGYYDKSVLTAPWSLSGRVAGEATRLSAAFLAPGRTNMLLPQQEDVLMDRGSSPTPASPLSPEDEIEQISRAKKLRRQQREVEAMAMEKKRSPGANLKLRAILPDRRFDMSPSQQEAHEASLERRLERQTSQPMTDRAIEQLVAQREGGKGKRPLNVKADEFLFKSPESVLFPNAPQFPCLGEWERTRRAHALSFKTTAYCN